MYTQTARASERHPIYCRSTTELAGFVERITLPALINKSHEIELFAYANLFRDVQLNAIQAVCLWVCAAFSNLNIRFDRNVMSFFPGYVEHVYHVFWQYFKPSVTSIVRFRCRIMCSYLFGYQNSFISLEALGYSMSEPSFDRFGSLFSVLIQIDGKYPLILYRQLSYCILVNVQCSFRNMKMCAESKISIDLMAEESITWVMRTQYSCRVSTLNGEKWMKLSSKIRQRNGKRILKWLHGK